MRDTHECSGVQIKRLENEKVSNEYLSKPFLKSNPKLVRKSRPNKIKKES